MKYCIHVKYKASGKVRTMHGDFLRGLVESVITMFMNDIAEPILVVEFGKANIWSQGKGWNLFCALLEHEEEE